MFLPADNYILLSLINTNLRDDYSALSDLCEEEGVDADEITSRLSSIGYSYEVQTNSFKLQV